MRKRYLKWSLVVAAALSLAAVAAGPALAQTLTRTHLAGIDDNFASPAEPVAYRGTACTSHNGQNVPWATFDDTTVNRVFCVTIPNLPKNIVCDPNAPNTNTLTVHMRALPDIPSNDTFNLFFGPDPSPRWSSPMTALNGGTWDAGNETTLTFDLCNMPAGNAGSVTDAAAEINTANELSLYIQDDTEVDYVSVTIEAQTVELIYGLMDSYALPTDPSYRSAAHTAARPNATRNFDDTSVNLAFGETLGNPSGTDGRLVPSGNWVVGGEIEIALKPAGELSCNDTIGITSYNLPPALEGALRWTRALGDPTACGQKAIANLAGMGSPPIPSSWDTSNAASGTTLFLDLDNLPPSANNGVTSVIPLLNNLLNNPSTLDFTAQDDTNIDYIKLRVLCSKHKPVSPKPHRIPTLSQFGMLLLVALLLGSGLALLATRKRKLA